MKQRLRPLGNPYFLWSLIILLTNDFYLKYEFHNWITGKLSDIAGLFVFVYFWTAIFPGLKKGIYLASALMFAFWKSSYSQSFIILFSENIYPIDRTIDLSDLLALLVLPISYSVNQNKHFNLEAVSIPIALLTIFSFGATSLPRPRQAFVRPEYVLFRSTNFGYENDNYPSQFHVHHFDSLDVIEVTEIETSKQPVLDDEYQKSQILSSLDLRVLSVIKMHSRQTEDLTAYVSLRNSLTVKGPTSVTIDLDSVSDELNFTGTRLDGPYKRFSKERQLLIEGWYKNGLHDSVWNFFDKAQKLTTRQYFVAGELTKIDKFLGDKSASVTVSTRKNSIAREYLILSAIALLFILTAAKLILNFKASDQNKVIHFSSLSKVSQVIILPTLIFISARIISSFVLNTSTDFFQVVASLVLTNIILIPIFSVIHYGIRLRHKYDLFLYILLSFLALIWITEYQYLQKIMI